MKKVILALGLFGLISCTKKEVPTKIHWRTSWDAKPDSNWILLEKKDQFLFWKKKDEKLCFGDMTIDSVVYQTFRNKIISISVNIADTTKSSDALGELLKYLSSTIGKYNVSSFCVYPSSSINWQDGNFNLTLVRQYSSQLQKEVIYLNYTHDLPEVKEYRDSLERHAAIKDSLDLIEKYQDCK